MPLISIHKMLIFFAIVFCSWFLYAEYNVYTNATKILDNPDETIQKFLKEDKNKLTSVYKNYLNAKKMLVEQNDQLFNEELERKITNENLKTVQNRLVKLQSAKNELEKKAVKRKSKIRLAYLKTVILQLKVASSLLKDAEDVKTKTWQQPFFERQQAKQNHAILFMILVSIIGIGLLIYYYYAVKYLGKKLR